MLRDVLRQIEQRSSFVLTSHARPDGDAIGSVLACAAILRGMGKKTEVVLHDGVPGVYRALPFAESVIQSPCVRNPYEAAIILECDSVQRTALEGLTGRFLINIDHHYSGRPFADVNWIDPHACATAELIFRLARGIGFKISREIATCLYTAVLTDTGMFAFPGTNANTFGLAKELVLCGADPVKIAQHVYFSNQTAKMRLLGAALSKLHREGPLAWMYVTRNDMDMYCAIDEDCEGLANWAICMEGVEVAVFFRELADRSGWRASLRSKGTINVAEVAEHFGGGGHACASGCGIAGPLSVASERVLAQLRIGNSRRVQ
jgi:bifunctional oligoribonuclease and PAP phosphatase NrnA